MTVVATTVVAMNRRSAVLSRIVATTQAAGRTVVMSGAARTTCIAMGDAMGVAPAPIMHFIGVIASRSPIATGVTWSRTGAATT